MMRIKKIRKIVRIGTTSLGVIIPKDWLEFKKIKYGDSVELTANGVVKIKPIKEGD